jgi:hypothetical protein
MRLVAAWPMDIQIAWHPVKRCGRWAWETGLTTRRGPLYAPSDEPGDSSDALGDSNDGAK